MTIIKALLRLVRVGVSSFKSFYSLLKIGANVEFGVKVSGDINLDLGDHVTIKSGVFIHGRPDKSMEPQSGNLILGDCAFLGCSVELGVVGNDQMFIGHHSTIQDRGKLFGSVYVGSYSTIAPNVYISSHNHFVDVKPHWIMRDQDNYVIAEKPEGIVINDDVVIEEDVWIGYGVFIASGVYIGKGAVIGSGSVVTKSVPPYEINAGSPSKIIRKRINLKPLDRLICSDEECLPYLYRGFGLSQDERSSSLSLRGVYASGLSVVLLKKRENICSLKITIENPVDHVEHIVVELNGRRVGSIPCVSGEHAVDIDPSGLSENLSFAAAESKMLEFLIGDFNLITLRSDKASAHDRNCYVLVSIAQSGE